MLAGCVTLAWLIACANVSTLMIAQWTVREHEFSILASLGANRARIVRMLLTESLLVAIAGGTLGIAATFAIHRVILRNAQTLSMFDASIHGDVLAGALFVTLLTGVLTGIAPALYETRRLQANPLAVAASDRVRQRWRHALVVTEIAATVALLVVAGTMIDAYRRTLSADLGFQTRSLLGVGVENPKGVVVGPVLELMKRQPGVGSVAAATTAPMMGAPPDLRMVTRDEGAAAAEAEAIRVSPGFFETLGVPVLAGRSFAATDTEAVRVAMVSEALARRLLSTPIAIGERVRFDGAAYTVIGIVGDYRRFPLSVPPPALYLSLRPDAAAATHMQFVMRTPIAAGPLFETLRRDVRRGGAGNLVTSTLAVDQVISVGAAEILAGTAPFVPLITIGLVLTAAGSSCRAGVRRSAALEGTGAADRDRRDGGRRAGARDTAQRIARRDRLCSRHRGHVRAEPRGPGDGRRGIVLGHAGLAGVPGPRADRRGRERAGDVDSVAAGAEARSGNAAARGLSAGLIRR